MPHGLRVTRRRVLRTGSVALATGVGAAALAACGETTNKSPAALAM